MEPFLPNLWNGVIKFNYIKIGKIYFCGSFSRSYATNLTMINVDLDRVNNKK